MKVIYEMDQATLSARDTVELAEGTTVKEGFYSYQKEQVFVVNSRMAEEDDVLHDGDRVLVFALLAGG